MKIGSVATPCSLCVTVSEGICRSGRERHFGGFGGVGGCESAPEAISPSAPANVSPAAPIPAERSS